jgi:hypothetical protein
MVYWQVCSTRVEDRAKYWHPRSNLYLFMAETRRLWDQEKAVPRLTTIQVGILLNVFHNLCGLDKVGQSFRLVSIRLSRELGLFTYPIRAESPRIRNGRLYTAWALYCWES